MIILLILSLLAIVGLLLLANLLLFNVPPGKRKKNAILKEMRADMAKWKGDLVPVGKEELELFSLSQDKKVLRTGMRTQAKGIFTTIYHEPVLAYSYRKFYGKKDNNLLLAQTANNEFVYWTRNGTTHLTIDGQEVGTIQADGRLVGRRTGKEIAQLAPPDESRYLPIRVHEREVGSLTSSESSKKGPSERAFEFILPEMTDQEEQLFLSLATRELVQRSMEG